MRIPVGKESYPLDLGGNLWVLGNYFFNLYLVEGDTATAIIEAGVSGVVDTVIAQLELLSVTPDYLIITHPHSDHITGLAGLRERYPDIRVVAGQGAREFAAHPKAVANMAKEDHHMSARLESIGFIPGRLPVSEFSFPDDLVIVEGRHEIDLGGIVLHCRLVQGHSPGSIVVHIPALGALATSDSLGFHFPGRGFLPLFFTDYRGYMETLDYMESLSPEILCPGHQGPLTGANVENAFKIAGKAAENMLLRIAKDQRDADQLVKELFREFYRDEFMIYTEDNIRNVARLLVRRSREYLQTLV